MLIPQASIRCLAPFGSLLEIGKFDMVVGSVLPMRAMLRGVNFQAIHLEQILVEGPNVDTSLVCHFAVSEAIDSWCSTHSTMQGAQEKHREKCPVSVESPLPKSAPHLGCSLRTHRCLNAGLGAPQDNVGRTRERRSKASSFHNLLA